MDIGHILALASCHDAGSFQQHLSKRAELMGFPLISAVYVDGSKKDVNPKVTVYSDVAAEYQEKSSDPEAIARDPVMMRIKRSHLPITYDQKFYVANGAADLWEEQAPFGYKTGIVLALHLPNNRHFAIGVDREEELPADPTALAPAISELHLLAVQAHAVAHRLAGTDHAGLATDVTPRLTRTEVDALRWTREGRCLDELSGLLKMPLSSTRAELRSARFKLQANTNHEAVLRATTAGLI
jgi:DNA-binding CsgD family transcriptional regulator